MERYVLNRADGVAVTSNAVSSVLEHKGFTGARITFPLGVDTEEFRPNGEEREQVRSRLGISQSDFVVGYVGRLVQEKGMGVLIRMIPAMCREGMKIVFVGNGPMLETLERIREQLPSTVYIASSVPHREVPKWMSAFDSLVLPSLTTKNWKEQFGRVILEAMACGVPVVGSDCGEIPNLINETGGGWIFPEGHDVKAMEVLGKVRTDTTMRRMRGRQGLQAVNSKFSKRAIAKRFSDSIAEIHYRRSMDVSSPIVSRRTSPTN